MSNSPPIQDFKINFPGFGNGLNRIGFLTTSATIAQLSAAGFLNPYVTSQGFSILATDILACACADGNQMLQPAIAAGTGIITLEPLGVKT